jgi:hypothetical protein
VRVARHYCVCHPLRHCITSSRGMITIAKAVLVSQLLHGFDTATRYEDGSSSKNNAHTCCAFTSRSSVSHKLQPYAEASEAYDRVYPQHKAGKHCDTANSVGTTTPATSTSHIFPIGPTSVPLLSLTRRRHLARLRSQISSPQASRSWPGVSCLRLWTART